MRIQGAEVCDVGGVEISGAEAAPKNLRAQIKLGNYQFCEDESKPEDFSAMPFSPSSALPTADGDLWRTLSRYIRNDNIVKDDGLKGSATSASQGIVFPFWENDDIAFTSKY